jgi:two-component system nitrate/nitrite response regulator NarL
LSTALPPVVLIVEDHVLLSTTLSMALRGHGIESRRCDGATPEAVRVAASGVAPGVALVDVDLGSGPNGEPRSGIDLVPVLVGDGWRVVVMTGSAPEAEIAKAVTAGAVGWVHKTAPFPELLTTVLDAVAGRPLMAESERQRLAQVHHVEQARDRARRAGLDLLTAREREVLDGLVAGKRAAAIAEESVVSLATVRAQIRAILAKLGVSSQLEAVALVRELDMN